MLAWSGLIREARDPAQVIVGIAQCSASLRRREEPSHEVVGIGDRRTAARYRIAFCQSVRCAHRRSRNRVARRCALARDSAARIINPSLITAVGKALLLQSVQAIVSVVRYIT